MNIDAPSCQIYLIYTSHCYTSLGMIKWWKKRIIFVKIKLHLNENIEWHCMQLEFSWIIIQSISIQQLD